MRISDVIGTLGCLENGRPVLEKEVQDLRMALDQDDTLRTEVMAEYKVTLERLEEILNMKPQPPQRRR